MKPILFNTDMVRALLEGRKTLTRRVVKPQPENAHYVMGCDTNEHTFDLLCGGTVSGAIVDYVETIKAPYWFEDILYVQETWQHLYRPERICIYGADADGREELATNWKGDWRPSIHMPRKAARLFLRVTDVRVERLQDITNEQAFAEGVECRTISEIRVEVRPALFEFQNLWNSTIKPKDRAVYSWEANPYVWVIEFERCEKPKED